MKRITRLLPVGVALLILCSCTHTRASPQAWNGLSQGMNRAELRETLGHPNHSLLNVDTWQNDGWELRATYDAAGQATTLVRVRVLQ